MSGGCEYFDICPAVATKRLRYCDLDPEYCPIYREFKIAEMIEERLESKYIKRREDKWPNR